MTNTEKTFKADQSVKEEVQPIANLESVMHVNVTARVKDDPEMSERSAPSHDEVLTMMDL